MRTLLRYLLLPLAIALPALATQAAPLIVTNSSWMVTPTGPAAGWNSSIAFDTSTWQPATELYDVGAPYSGAKGIWSSGGQFSTVETQIWARGVFNLSTLPLSALLTNGFDDDGDLYVNGFLVVSDHNGFANNSFADITPYLVAGDNLIAYTASDNYPVWGYNHSSWVYVDAQFIPEPATLALLGVGLAGIGLGRRRLLKKRSG